MGIGYDQGHMEALVKFYLAWNNVGLVVD